MTIRAILLDLGDTVVRLDPFPADLTGALATRIADTLDPRSSSPDGLAAVIESVVRADIADASATARRREVDIEAIVERELATTGLTASRETIASISDVYGEADVGRIRAVSGRLELLERFRRQGMQLVIVSNTTTRPALLTAMLEDFGLGGCFDALTYSSELGVRKPHSEVYERALLQIGVPAHEALFVGDRLREDVNGPIRAGMRAVLTHEFHQDPHDGEPAAVINHLEELLEVIARLPASTPSDARGR